MPDILSAPRTARVPIEEMISKLELYVAQMEHRYECTSATMAEDLAAGRVRETAEVIEWIGEYHALMSLRAHSHAAG